MHNETQSGGSRTCHLPSLGNIPIISISVLQASATSLQRSPDTFRGVSLSVGAQSQEASLKDLAVGQSVMKLRVISGYDFQRLSQEQKWFREKDAVLQHRDSREDV